MSRFRRREPLHRRLAREGGLDDVPPAVIDPARAWAETGIHGIQRPREWDVVLTVPAEIDAERATFAALPDGSLVVEEGPDELTPLADAVERELSPPYRAEAVRRGASVWAVAARRITVVSLPDQAGEELELSVSGGARTLLVDGERAFGGSPALEALLDGDGVVRGVRIEGAEWDVRVDRL